MISTSETRSPYRADIDGLRAIAVLAVLVFHIKASFLPGGFAGVDVFFVISGFLITSNIARGMSDNRFSFSEFYRRRILRIIPPLMIVAIVSLILGQFIFLPEDLNKLAWSAVASALSVANIYFYAFLDTSYFAADASVNPLLHLWSLGVEEQFYIFWPIALIGLMTVKPRMALWLTFGVGAASFLFAEFMVHQNPMFAYYMLPTRAGQLLAGATVFFLMRAHSINLGIIARTLISLIGAALLFASLIFISEEIPYPGYSALPVTVGTALIIFSGCMGPNIVNRLIGNRVSVFIGLISYSLYLWHWPIFAFYKYLFGSFTLLSGTLATALVFALTYLTYIWVEKPVRAWKAPLWPVARNLFVAPTAAITALLVAFLATSGYGLYKFTEYPDRLEGGQNLVRASLTYDYICQKPELEVRDLTDPRCLINTADEPKVLLWGDSNAAHFVGLLGAIAEEQGFGFRNIAHSSCPPFLNDAGNWAYPENRKQCHKSAQLVSGIVDQYDVIILSASWARSLNGFDQTGRAELRRTIQELTKRGKSIILMGKIPRLENVDSSCYSKKLKVPAVNCAAQGNMEDVGEPNFNEFLSQLAASTSNVDYYSARKYFCDGSLCSPFLKTKNAYYDSGHLNIPGSWELGRLMLQEEGLPSAFSALLNVTPTSYETENLEQHLAQKFRPDEDLVSNNGTEILTQESLKSYWKGDIDRGKSSGDYRFSDATSEKFNAYTYTLSESVDTKDDAPVLANIHIRIELPNGNTPIALFRVQNAENSRLRYDLMVDLTTDIIKTKRLMTLHSVRLEKTNRNRTIYLVARDVDLTSDILLRVYPAAALELGQGYDESAVGDIDVRSIKYYIEKGRSE